MKSNENNSCYEPINAAMQVIGSKWSYFVIAQLCQGAQRFNQLRRSIGEVSVKSLTDTLRQLEHRGIIHRQVIPTVPVSVHYSLSESGREYGDVLLQMRNWGEKWGISDSQATSL